LTGLWLETNQLTGSIPPLPSSLVDCKLWENMFSDTSNKGVCQLTN